MKDYQTKRLEEKAAPKSINEETGFLLRLLTEQGDFIRAKMRREKTLKLTVRRQIARAFTPKEKAAPLAKPKSGARLPSIRRSCSPYMLAFVMQKSDAYSGAG